MKATRERPSQFLKLSQTKGCWGWKLTCAISFDFKEWGSSIFLPPVSLPIFHFKVDTLLLLTVHEERKGEGPLAETLGLRLQLLQLSFRQAAKLENQAASSGALSTVDMTTDHNGKVLLLGIGWHGVVPH